MGEEGFGIGLYDPLAGPLRRLKLLDYQHILSLAS